MGQGVVCVCVFDTWHVRNVHVLTIWCIVQLGIVFYVTIWVSSSLTLKSQQQIKVCFLLAPHGPGVVLWAWPNSSFFLEFQPIVTSVPLPSPMARATTADTGRANRLALKYLAQKWHMSHLLHNPLSRASRAPAGMQRDVEAHWSDWPNVCHVESPFLWGILRHCSASF